MVWVQRHLEEVQRMNATGEEGDYTHTPCPCVAIWSGEGLRMKGRDRRYWRAGAAQDKALWTRTRDELTWVSWEDRGMPR
jgi:hypothetical protein